MDKALAAGHEVTAFVRDAAKLGISHGSLQVVEGDALNAAQVEQVLKGRDAVLSTLGPKGKPAVMAAESTRNIIKGMEKHDIRRLVLVSVAGIAVPQDRRGRSVVDSLLKCILNDVFTDRENQLAVLEASSVDWIAVRVPRLTDDPAQDGAATWLPDGAHIAFTSDRGGALAVSLLDVCGHGVGAALLSISAMNVIRSQSLPDTDFRRPNLYLFLCQTV